MAFASDSTTAPEPHRALLLQRVCDSVTAGIGRTLDRMSDAARAAVEGRIKPVRDARGRFIKRSDLADLSPADEADLDDAVRALFAEIGIGADEASSATEPDAVEDVRRDLDALIAATEPLLSARCNSASNDFSGLGAGRGDTAIPLARHGRAPSCATVAQTPIEPDTASAARTSHLRRQLEAAAEHGVAMLAALDRPRLVGPDFIRHDTVAVADALDLAIATLDALDGDPDIEDEGEAEPSFGWDARPSQIHLWNGCIQGDLELDTADAEPSLASPERHPRVPDFQWGPVYTARGGEEGQLRWAEGAQHDGEAVNEDGDDLDAGEHDTADRESYLGWPEDPRAVMSTESAVLTADPDAEHDDVDREGDERHGHDVWVFGPSRGEVAHV